MDSNAYTAMMFQSLVNLITGIAWPVAVLILTYNFRSQVRELLERLVEAEGFGIKGKFERASETVEKAAAETSAQKAAAETSAQAGQASATGTAFNPTVRTRESLVSTIAERVSENPSGAVVASYVEVEKVLRARMEEAKVAGADSLRGDQLVDLATRENVIPSQIAAAVRSLLSLRNLAVHGKDIDVRTALAFLSLCDTMIYSIEIWPRQSD
jgi:hypothetical protein